MRAAVGLHLVARSGLYTGDPSVFMFQLLHAVAQEGGASVPGQFFPAGLPHHARSEAGVVKLFDQGRHHFTSLTLPVLKQGIAQGLAQRQVADPLGGPV